MLKSIPRKPGGMGTPQSGSIEPSSRPTLSFTMKALSVPELRRMATTLTAIVVETAECSTRRTWEIADCTSPGESRLRKSHRITRMVAEQIRRGLMTAEERQRPSRALDSAAESWP